MNKTLSSLDSILKRRKVIVTCGTGGVGKTTVSAALALKSAQLGYKTLVITIDPAKRLAQALGLDDQSATEKPHSLSPNCDAILPETKKTFEHFIRDISPNEASAERIMRNPIFQIFAREFSGTNEYMAMEKLLYLYEAEIYDRIILDTPPSRNTLDFLDAPRLLSQFFEERFVRWLVIPQNKVVAAGLKTILGLLEKLTGSHFMTHLIEFAQAMVEVQSGFTANMSRILKLLESESVGFTLVTTPTQDISADVSAFLEALKAHQFHFDGILFNKTFSHLSLNESSNSNSPELNQALAIIASLQAHEQTLKSKLAALNLPLLVTLPQLTRDIHSVEDLSYVAHDL